MKSFNPDGFGKFLIGLAIFLCLAYFGVIVFHGLFTGSWVLAMVTAGTITFGTIGLIMTQGNGYRFVIFAIILIILALVGYGGVMGLAEESRARVQPPNQINEVTKETLTNLFIPSAAVVGTLTVILLVFGLATIIANYLEASAGGFAWLSLIIGGITLAIMLWPQRSVLSPAQVATTNDIFWMGALQAGVWSAIVSGTAFMSKALKGLGAKGALGLFVTIASMFFLYSTSIVGVEHAFYPVAVNAVIEGVPVDHVYSMHMTGKMAGIVIPKIASSVLALVVSLVGEG